MLNFRDELKKIEEGVESEWSIKECSEIFMMGLVSALKQYMYSIKCFVSNSLFFVLSKDTIHVKFSEAHISELFSMKFDNSTKVFEFILNRFKEEKFRICEKTSQRFIIYFN